MRDFVNKPVKELTVYGAIRISQTFIRSTGVSPLL